MSHITHEENVSQRTLKTSLGLTAHKRNRNSGVLNADIDDSEIFENPNCVPGILYVLNVLLTLPRLISPSHCELLPLFKASEV